MCRFLKHLSAVDYRYGTIRSATQIAKLLKAKVADRKQRIPMDLVKIIRDRVEDTEKLPEESRALLYRQGLVSA